MTPIAVPKPQMSAEQKEYICIETTFGRLLESANFHDMDLRPCMGLMYLHDMEATKKFIEGCRAVLRCLHA